MKEQIQLLARQYHAGVVANRRHLHTHPELSFQEVQTGKFVAGRLAELGIEHKHGMAGNGVVALIKGKKPKKRVVALRGDMDALPIPEANKVPYKSQNEGVMHACGHDVHTSSLLGTARILHELREQFEGTVKCIFQPGEERLPGGASMMIAEGVLENPRPASIFGQHVHPPLRAGMVGLKSGIYMASADEIYVTVKGRGGHGAMPHECIDPIAIAAQLIVTLQQIVSRYADPAVPSVLTFGKINSIGGATNVIPNEVKLEGTFRTMHEKWRAEAHKRMKKMAESVAKSMGAACEFNILKGYPVLYNHDALTARTKQWAIEFLGNDKVVDLPLRMTAEDFAYFSQVLPACFYRLGTGNPERGITSPIHTDTFDVDESALETGVGLMAWLAIKELGM
ncbi:MAG: amidohydrolase [Haliscomenobacteraceae bacterium CHB4]|nr:N-acetyldiaminopimelate deacetylase [Saprospiraceae bacterium]MCE7922215.1 amidohydrolase [Haliscomenobacteraceae bacterium CHB4]